MGYVRKYYILIFVYVFNCACSISTAADIETETPPCCVLPESITGIKSGDRPDNFAELKFAIPDQEQQIKYLGLDPVLPGFSLSQISGSVLVLEVFTSYCPYCERETEKLNHLYLLLEQQDLDREIKIIAIGMSCFKAEAERFARKNKVLYPVFSDPQNKTYYLIGRKRTPYLAILLKNENRGYQLVLDQEETLSSAEELLKLIREKTGF